MITGTNIEEKYIHLYIYIFPFFFEFKPVNRMHGFLGVLISRLQLFLVTWEACAKSLHIYNTADGVVP